MLTREEFKNYAAGVCYHQNKTQKPESIDQFVSGAIMAYDKINKLPVVQAVPVWNPNTGDITKSCAGCAHSKAHQWGVTCQENGKEITHSSDAERCAKFASIL